MLEISTEQLMLIIGSKEAELYVLRLKVALLEHELQQATARAVPDSAPQ